MSRVPQFELGSDDTVCLASQCGFRYHLGALELLGAPFPVTPVSTGVRTIGDDRDLLPPKLHICKEGVSNFGLKLFEQAPKGSQEDRSARSRIGPTLQETYKQD